MNSVTNKINNYKYDDYYQYASNDSGLSCNSNGGTESDIKFSTTEFHCDDLTKSLFMNSFGGNELIQDDDIYSYKSKMDIDGIFPNKFLSFNLLKIDNFNLRSASTFSSIINDVENLKLLDPANLPRTINNISCRKEGSLTPSIINASLRIAGEIKHDNKIDSYEKTKSKRSLKKNTTQEYLSSTIKDYQGDKALNDIVSYIQGSNKQSKTTSPNKIKRKTPPIKVDESPSLRELEVIVTVELKDNTEKSPEQYHCNIDIDSGTQSSQFVSLNNSDEDSINFVVEDFQQVVSKKQKKITTKSEIQSLSYSQPKTVSNMSCNGSKKISNKVKKGGKYKIKGCSNTILHSKESLQDFLSNQYSLFSLNFNTVS